MPNWPHAPPHYIGAAGVYMVTASTYGKLHHFGDDNRLEFLHDLLLDLAPDFGWQLEAWAILSNHYHFIARSIGDTSESLRAFISKLHGVSSRQINRMDATPGRKVWHNYRDTHITNEKSHLARLHYVHANAVHHGLVLKPDQYRWCSARWFESNESPARVQTVYSFPISRLLESDVQ